MFSYKWNYVSFKSSLCYLTNIPGVGSRYPIVCSVLDEFISAMQHIDVHNGIGGQHRFAGDHLGGEKEVVNTQCKSANE